VRIANCSVDKLKEDGQHALRLGPNHPDLNPNELVRGDAKKKKGIWKKSGCSVKKYFLLHKRKWKNRCFHMKKLEEECLQRDCSVAENVDSMIIQLPEISHHTSTVEDF
jgi:hypothetical protein